MPGVSVGIAEETFRDTEAAPSFVPHLVSLEFLRGQPSQVGTCWKERRIFGGREIVVRKAITKMSEHPFMCCQVVEPVDADWSLPNFVSTFTVVIDSSAEASGCTFQWSDAFLSTGVCGRVLSVLCLPCLKRAFISQVEEELQYYYEEALRRTIKEGKRDGETEPELEQKGQEEVVEG